MATASLSLPAAAQRSHTQSARAGHVRDGQLHLPRPIALHHGGALRDVCINYRIEGPPDAPVVVALGGISATRAVASSDARRPGWWSALVGAGLALCTRQFRVLAIDWLGAARSPANDDVSLSTFDQAEALQHVLDHLRIGHLHGFVGASYGGMVALAFAQRYPASVRRLLVLSAAHCSDPLATAWRALQRRIIEFALRHDAGTEGVTLARALAMTTYRSRSEFARRFDGAPAQTHDGFRFRVEDYLLARGRAHAAAMAPEVYLRLSESIDLHRVDPAKISVPATLIAVRSDQLVPVEQMRELARRLRGGSELHEIDSLYGHDAFLKEAQHLTPLFRRTLQESAA